MRRMILPLLLSAAAAGGCATGKVEPEMQITVLDAGHYKLLPPAEAPDAYALPEVRAVWRITDVGLRELEKMKMEFKR